MIIKKAKRAGFTRLELLILLVIILGVAGLLFTYIGKQRESANRAYCAHNLKRVGEAILGFHEQNKFLPAARIAPGYATWAVQIAPYLQKDSGLEDWDPAKRYADQSATAREAVLPPLFCPGRRRSVLLSMAGEGPSDDPLPGTLGDYACASGDGNPQRPWTGALANGAIIVGEVLEEKDALILRWQGRTSLASLRRGQSYTLVVGEKHVPQDQIGQTAAGDGCLYDGGRPASSSRIGGPNFPIAPSPLAPIHANFGSPHAGICQFLHADGSVRPYATSMPEDLLATMIRRE